MKKICLVILVFFFLILTLGCSTEGGGSDATQTEEVLIYIEMETTSDWTDLVIGDEPLIIRGMVTWYTPSHTCCTSLNEERLSLQQPLAEAEAGEQVSMEVIVRVLLPTTGTFPVTIERGHVGATTARFYRFDTEVATPLGEITWEGLNTEQPENSEYYSIPVLPDAGSASALPYEQAALESMVDQWWEVIMGTSSDWQGLYWDDAEYVTLNPEDDLVIIETPSEHLGVFEQDPEIDYSLLSHSPQAHIPCEEQTEAKIFITELFDDEDFSSTVFRFRKEGDEWRVYSQTWKIGFELP